MARPFLADPDFVNKAAEGRADEINTCIGCNQACLDHTFGGKLTSCLVNPRACHETELNYLPRQQIKNIAVVGAGPRGTSVLERLCASAPELLPPGVRLTVHVIDPAPPGAGSVWRAAQSPELLMNTVACQVTLFTDDSVDCSGPVRPGPSLHEWAGGELGADDYPTRADYGRYLEWVFAKAVREAPPAVHVVTHRARAALPGQDRLVEPTVRGRPRSARREAAAAAGAGGEPDALQGEEADDEDAAPVADVRCDRGPRVRP